MTAARPFPVVPLVLAAVIAFAAAFGIGLAAKKSSSSPAAPAHAPVVSLPTQAPKVTALVAAGTVPALRSKPHKKKAPSTSNATTSAQTTQTTQTTQTSVAPSTQVQSTPTTHTGGGSTGGGSTGGGSTGGGSVGGGSVGGG